MIDNPRHGSLIETDEGWNMTTNLTDQQRFIGLLLGGAVGDAIGLPAEGMSAARIACWWLGELKHRFVFGRGMISDDTEHALMTAQALVATGGDVEKFRRVLGWKLHWWILGFPAGVGLATARSCLRLWVGISPERSGVASAGNGAAMRSAIIGARFAKDKIRRHEFVAASALITHTDARAQTAALAIAEAAAWILNSKSAAGFAEQLPALGSDNEWRRVCAQLADALEAGKSVSQFAEMLGLKSAVTGYAYHTIPVALFAWIRHRGDYRQTIENVVRCGGDTDTVAAIAGALAGCEVGREGIPAGWLAGLKDWPRSAKLIERIAVRVTEDGAAKPVRYFWPGIIPRNLIFFVIILCHGFRRLFPPYSNPQSKG
ncbi:MAG: ADP-ribosylglycohydrolase family protein [Verrucomicrobiota bacterium]